MNRRDLLKTTLAAGAAVAVGGRRALAAPSTAPFRLKYAPHFGMFENHAGKDLVDQLKFGADQGFTAWEDNGMPGRPVAEQERVAKEMARLGLTMGVFVAMGDFENVTFASTKPEIRADILAKGKAAVEVAKRVNAKWTTVVPGRYDVGLEWDYQTANVIDNLKRLRRGPRAGRARDGPRAAQRLEGPPRALPHQGPAGLPDLPGGGKPLVQDPVRHVPPADHRGEHHPEHRPRVGARSPTSSRATTRAARSPPPAR